MALSPSDIQDDDPEFQAWMKSNGIGGASAAPEQKQNSGIVGDTGTGLKRGIEQIPGMATGLADIPFNLAGANRPISKAADWLGEQTGFQPGKWAEDAGKNYSPQLQEQLKTVEDTKGFWDTAGAYATNPRALANAVTESLPSTIVGGGVGRGLMTGVMGAEKLLANRAAVAAGGEGAALARKELLQAGATAGGIGEGAVTAGQQMSQTGYDVDPQRAALTSAAAGIGTGLIGKYSGKLANRLGLEDIDADMAAGVMSNSKSAGKLGYAKGIAGGALTEGVLEELPQSAQEQIWQNVANGKPWDEGVSKAGASGMMAGMAMGAGINARPNFAQTEPKPVDDKQPVNLLGHNPEVGTSWNNTYNYNPIIAEGDESQVPLQQVDILHRGREITEASEMMNADLSTRRQDALYEMPTFDLNDQTLPLPTDPGSAVAVIQVLSHAQQQGQALTEGSAAHEALIEAQRILKENGLSYLAQRAAAPAATQAPAPKAEKPTKAAPAPKAPAKAGGKDGIAFEKQLSEALAANPEDEGIKGIAATWDASNKTNTIAKGLAPSLNVAGPNVVNETSEAKLAREFKEEQEGKAPSVQTAAPLTNEENIKANPLDQRDAVKVLLDSLSEQERQVIDLYHYDKRTLRDVGSVLAALEGRPEKPYDAGSVNFIRNRAIAKMKAGASKYGVDPDKIAQLFPNENAKMSGGADVDTLSGAQLAQSGAAMHTPGGSLGLDNVAELDPADMQFGDAPVFDEASHLERGENGEVIGSTDVAINDPMLSFDLESDSEGNPIPQASIDAALAEWEDKDGTTLPKLFIPAWVQLSIAHEQGLLNDRQYGETYAEISNRVREAAPAPESTRVDTGSEIRSGAPVGEGVPTTRKTEVKAKRTLAREEVTAPAPTTKGKLGAKKPGVITKAATNPATSTDTQLGSRRFSDARKAAEWLAANAKQPFIRVLMQRVSGLVNNVPINYWNVGDAPHERLTSGFRSGDTTAHASRNLDTGEGIIDLRVDNGNSEETLAHEIFHAATILKLNDPKLAEPINALRKAVLRALGTDKGRWPIHNAEVRNAQDFFKMVMNDADEFLAYALTNSAFRDIMKHMAADGSWMAEYHSPEQLAKINKNAGFRKQKTTFVPELTLWQKFVDALRTMFNIPKVYAPKLEALLEANDAIKENNRKAITVEFKTLEEEIESRFADLLAAEEPALRAAESDSSERVDNPGELSKASKSVVGDFAEKVAGTTGMKIVDDTENALKKAAYSLGSLHDLVEEFKAKLPTAVTWYKSVQATIATRKQLEADAEQIAFDAGKLKNGTQAVNEFISKSTYEQKWGYAATFPKLDGTTRTVVADPAMATEFRKLSAEEQALVKAVFAHSEKMALTKFQMMKDLGLESVLDTAGKLSGPYAPLKRFGNFVSVLKSKELIAAEAAADTKKISELKASGDHYVVSYFDTKGSAMQFARENQSKWAFTDAFEGSTRVNEGRVMKPEILQKVLSAARMNKDIDPVARDAYTKMVQDLYFQSIDEHSARTSGLKRLNRAGYDADMIRSFLSHARAEAGFLSNMKHGGETNDQFYQLQQAAKDKKTGHWVAQDEFNALAKHYAENLVYKETPWQDRAMALTSAWQLATSVGYHVTNAMQGIMVTVPKLAADFNNYSGAWNALMAGYKTLSSTGWKGGALDLSKVQNVGLRKALQLASDMGVLDVGMEEDLTHFDAVRSGYEAVDKASKVARTALHKLRGVSRAVETANRVAAATAGYNMSIAAGKTTEEAQDYAIRILQTTQGDFSRVGAPLLLKKLPKVMTQYRKYQFMMAALYAKAFRDAFMSSDAETTAIGRRMLKFKLFHTSIAAGVLGMPLMNLAAMVFAAAGGDDEPKDLERTLRESIGDETMANLLLHGPMAMLGLDMSGKLGDDKIFSIMPYGKWDFSSAQGVKDTVFGLAGPAASQAGKFADGVGFAGKGEYYKSLEKFMPKGVSDGMKAFRVANEGYTLKNGDVMIKPEDINGLALALDAIGMPSTELKRMDWIRGQQYEIKRFYVDHTKELEHDYNLAFKEKDTAKMSELRQDWIDLQKGKDHMRQYFDDRSTELKRQPLSNLLTSPQTQAKRERKLQMSIPE